MVFVVLGCFGGLALMILLEVSRKNATQVAGLAGFVSPLILLHARLWFL